MLAEDHSIENNKTTRRTTERCSHCFMDSGSMSSVRRSSIFLFLASIKLEKL